MKGQITRTNLLGVGLTIVSAVFYNQSVQERNIIYQEQLRRQSEITAESISESREDAMNSYSCWQWQNLIPLVAMGVGCGCILYKSKEKIKEEIRSLPK